MLCIQWLGRIWYASENAAFENNIHPRDGLMKIAKNMKAQLKICRTYDWDREISTCDPEY